MSGEALNPELAATAAMQPPPPSSGRRWSPRGAREAMQPERPPAPPPPRRPHGRGFLGRVSAFLTFLVFLSIGGVIAFMYGQSVQQAPGPLQQDKVVFIPRGNGPTDIADILEQEGVISNARAFELFHLLAGRPALKAGEYQFKQASSLTDVRDVLSRGRSIEHSMTVPEGLTSEQIVQRLRENEILVGEIRTIPREGALLPDTYRFERGTSREQLLLRMESSQRRMLQEIWSRRSPDIPVKTPADLVILASIVEKETGRADERPRVASVFINRINRGMRLESDPTIIYGLVGGKGSLGRGILATEIRQPTPYNTYVINGLPPGPIGNPGRAALEATANPSRTRDIFFVADGTGGHAFAETYEQHQRNVARWRQIESGGAAPALAPVPAPAPATPPNAAPQGRPGQQRSDVGPSTSFQPATAVTEATPFRIPQPRLEVFSAFTDPVSPSGAFVDQPASTTGGGVESFPVAPGRRQSMRQNAAQAGAGTSGPAPVIEAEPLLPEAGANAAAAATRRGPARGFDAVEGTTRDPLRNKTFDLNSPKTVPVLR
ncbi:MAG: endolytic transglycosylase MltG [Beijerinckiaceae bacterium]